MQSGGSQLRQASSELRRDGEGAVGRPEPQPPADTRDSGIPFVPHVSQLADVQPRSITRASAASTFTKLRWLFWRFSHVTTAMKWLTMVGGQGICSLGVTVANLHVVGCCRGKALLYLSGALVGRNVYDLVWRMARLSIGWLASPCK